MHDAFISYSRKDIAFARLLEKALEDYKPPRDLNVPQRYIDVFRDEADFAGGEYYQALERHLAESKKLIVICSPHARASSYVDDEIRRFTKMRGAEHIIPLWLAGVPNNEVANDQHSERAFPEALCEVLTLPLAISYRGFDAAKDRFQRGAFLTSWHSLLASLYEVSRADIEQRENRRVTRNRRIRAAVAIALIAVLSVALVVSLLSRRQAIEQREIADQQRRVAEKAAQAEKAAKLLETAAREEAQRQEGIAKEQRDEANRQREAAEREAIAARRETANRVAVQALEKLDGAPNKALELAIAAVETFRKHGDPLVPAAVGALQKVMLGFSESRPVLAWRNAKDGLAISPALTVAATSDSTGSVTWGRVGAAQAKTLKPPNALLPGERWANAESKLVFGRDRLIAMRSAEKPNADEPRAVVWYWRVSAEGIEGDATLLETFKPAGWSNVRPQLSPDGQWLAWSDGDRHVFVKSFDRPGGKFVAECSWIERCAYAFSFDSTLFVFKGRNAFRRFALNRAGAAREPNEKSPAPPVQMITEWEPIETRIRDVSRIALFTGERYPELDGKRKMLKVIRLAVLGVDGEVEWWEIADRKPVRYELGNVFGAFQDRLEVFGLERNEIDADLKWGPAGNALLVTIAESKQEFGIGAVHTLEGNEGPLPPGKESWRPLWHRYERMATERNSRVQGGLGGVRQGYRMKNGADLGVASALWMSPDGVLTLGFDGTLLFRDLSSLDKFQLIAVDGSTVAFSNPLLIVGQRSGKLQFFHIRSRSNKAGLELNGHDAPVREIRGVPTRDGLARLVSTDANGIVRAWPFEHPTYNPNDQRYPSADWKWLINPRGGAEFRPLTGGDPFVRPHFPDAFSKAAQVAVDPTHGWAATLQIEAQPQPVALVRLWSFDQQPPATRAILERRYPLKVASKDTIGEFRLAGADRNPRIVFQVNGAYQAVWTADLADRAGQIRRIGEENLKFAVADASPDLAWLLLRTTPPPGAKPLVLLAHQPANASNASKVFPLGPLEISYTEAFSSDGRWLVLNTKDGRYFIDLPATAKQQRVKLFEHSFGDITLGRNRPPLSFDSDGNIFILKESGRFEKLVSDANLSAIGWDDSGEWLGLGYRDGVVRLLRPALPTDAAQIAAQVRKRPAIDALPLPSDSVSRYEIDRIFVFPSLGWVVAGTEDRRVLIWLRGPSGEWNAPLVFTAQELRLDSRLRDVQLSSDGTMALIGGQIFHLNPDLLLRQGRDVLGKRMK